MKIVIAGGGFAGISAGLALVRNKPADTTITLIDRYPFHLFTPSLYEVATSEEPRRNIAIPFYEIFKNKIDIETDKIEKIDIGKKELVLGKSKTSFDYLILALGSESAFYGIPGLENFSLPLKTIFDAVKIKDEIHKLTDQKALKEQIVKIIIGGGGFAGTELAAEILGYVKRLSKQHKIPRKLFEVFIIQGSDKLLKELDEHVSNFATARLKKLGAEFMFGGHIKEVKEKELMTDKGDKYSFDLLIWTGGVKPSSLLKDSGLTLSKSGQVQVNDQLQVKGHPHIFAVGDVAEFAKGDKKAPGVAQVAEEEGKIAGENLARLIEKKELKNYKLRHFGYLIPLQGRYAVFTSGMFHMRGLSGWIIQQLVFLRYLLEILSFPKAFKRWNKFEKDLRQE